MHHRSVKRDEVGFAVSAAEPLRTALTNPTGGALSRCEPAEHRSTPTVEHARREKKYRVFLSRSSEVTASGGHRAIASIIAVADDLSTTTRGRRATSNQHGRNGAAGQD